MNTRSNSKSHKIRILFYTDSLGIGGAEISLGHLIKTVSDSIEVVVVGVSDQVVDAIASGRPQVTRHVLPNQGLSSWFDHRRVFQTLHPDIIHINLCTPWEGALGLSAALSLPQVRVVRVDQLPLRTTAAISLWRTRALCLRVDAHVAVGEASARRMEDFYALGRNTVISIPNGVPDRNVNSSPSAKPVNGPLVVGSIGRLDAMKGHDLLLRAIAPIEGVKVVILGEGEQRSILEKLAIELGISDRVEMPGWVDDPQLYLPQFDVVALPSRSEGFPLAMVEAMLAARPVIATQVGSMPEAVMDHKTGLLVEKDDLSGLVTAIRYLRDHPCERMQLGQRARQQALAHFTVEAMTSQYETLWSQLLQQPRTPRFRVPRPQD